MLSLKSNLTSLPTAIRTKVGTIFSFWPDKDAVQKPKKEKAEGKKIKIITHSGDFHPDDVFACATLSLILGEENVKIIRTRDEEIIKAGDYIVDVGSIYDPDTNHFDHHQKERVGERENGIPYASFGLVWKKFGEELCKLISSEDKVLAAEEAKMDMKKIAQKIDKRLVQPIDALDNGIDVCPLFKDDILPYDIGELNDAFLPSWKEEKNFYKGFYEILEIAKKILQREIIRTKHKEEANQFVVDIYNATKDKRIIELTKSYYFHEALHEFPEPLFVVSRRSDDKWMVRAVRTHPRLHTERKKMPKEWAGLRDEELAKVSGVPDAIFCHIGLWIAVTETRDGALALAKKALGE